MNNNYTKRFPSGITYTLTRARDAYASAMARALAWLSTGVGKGLKASGRAVGREAALWPLGD